MQIEKLILNKTKGLPASVLQEILDYIDFMRYKNNIKTVDNNINFELSSMNETETKHLDEEFKNYKEIFPYEK